MLRSESSGPRARLAGVALAGAVGVLAALLVAAGNPGNMGVCGACFLRDAAGAMKLFAGGPAYLRPELVGVVGGALVAALATRRFGARSGGFAAGRFALGIVMGIAAIVFLGCPFRMLQRLGGGDLNAWLALPGFVAGVFVGTLFERRGYSPGKTSPAPAAVGLVAPALAIGLLALFLVGGVLAGPGPGDAAAKPPHAPWALALGIALVAGVILGATGFCAVSATRQLLARGPKSMLAAAGALVAGYALAAAIGGRLHVSFAGQPFAHSDWLWNVVALGLLGLTGALAGGCPVRQLVMAGEGNGDALVCVAGIALGGALAHNWALVSVPAGPDAPGGSTPGGHIALGLGWAFAILWALAITRALAPKHPPSN